jgi:FkbM family methyltransferase
MKVLYRKLKILFRVLMRKELLYKSQLNIPMKWYGNTGAGFFVNEDNLDANSIIYSIGVGEDISFDRELIKRFGCKVYGFDPTPKSIDFIKKQSDLSNYFFYPYGLFNKDGFIEFYLPDDSRYVSGSFLNRWNYNAAVKKPIQVPVKKFSSIIAELNHHKIDVLKMDIEGAEYDVVDDILNSGVIIDQIVVEFHHRFPGVGINKTIDFINKLNSAGYKISKISESKEEYSFFQTK